MALDLLTEIVGAKVKVAILRTLTFSSGIPARQIQTKSGKSWGAVKQAIDALLATGIILVKKGKWNDEIYFNTTHCLYPSILSLFQAEKDFLTKIAALIFSHSVEYKLDLLSCYLLADCDKIYLVSKYPKGKDTTEQIHKFAKTHGLPKEFSIEIIDSTGFASIWHELPHPNNFLLIQGETFPYRGVERALAFFDIESHSASPNSITYGGK